MEINNEKKPNFDPLCPHFGGSSAACPLFLESKKKKRKFIILTIFAYMIPLNLKDIILTDNEQISYVFTVTCILRIRFQ